MLQNARFSSPLSLYGMRTSRCGSSLVMRKTARHRGVFLFARTFNVLSKTSLRFALYSHDLESNDTVELVNGDAACASTQTCVRRANQSTPARKNESSPLASGVP